MRLSINIDHVATLRNARGGSVPDPVKAARACEEAGATGIVCHLREDRRHIRDRDLARLRATLETKLDLEMAATPEIIRIALNTRPDLVTLVPERRRELTTEGGLNVAGQTPRLKKVVARFHASGIPVSLFVDPSWRQVATSAEVGADMVELHTGEYADAKSAAARRSELKRIRAAAKLGKELGLGVNAGHGLDYDNVVPVARIEQIDEVSIGHAVIVRALAVGLHDAVAEMRKLVVVKR